MAWSVSNLSDIYLFRWNKWTFLILIIVMILWLWTVDRRMREDGYDGIWGWLND